METAVEFLTKLYELDATAPNTGIVYKHITEYVTTLKNTPDCVGMVNDVLGNTRWTKLKPYTASCLLRNCYSMRAHIAVWGTALRIATTAMSQQVGPDDAKHILRGLTH